ncbi:porin family protein [Flavobacterium sp. CYK-4]|uniref:outer membrane beta-barrel protein n=1 Tax=Flavobacterium lotistagni TaxID=2709660 RepID=UPI0014077CB8|nr:outer membrane beta-barrel protein [Flavobacterium lotistagni]NHM07300.1 porin family protein [Flavobacterium lotistagni]
MKKIILSAVAILAFGFANAQDKKEGGAGLGNGDLYLSGTFNISNVKEGDRKADNLTIRPGVGYMFSDNMAIEGSLGYTSGKTTDAAGNDTSDMSGFGLSAGVKYFFTPADSFSLSIGGMLSYDMNTDKALVAGADDVKTTVIGLNVPVGLHYFVSNNFAITTTWGGLGYSSSKPDTDGADAENKINLGLNLSTINFGLIYKL